MLNKTIERCYVFRADCRNNELYSCDYLYICDMPEDFNTKIINYRTTSNIICADKFHYKYKKELEIICDYINENMEQHGDKIEFKIVLVEFTAIVKEVEDKRE